MRGYLAGAACALVFGAAGGAEAAITPVLANVQQVGGNYQYTYDVTISGDTGLAPGARFAILDFAGLVGLPTVSMAGWSVFSVSGALPSPTNTLQDPSTPDIGLVWSGDAFHTTDGPYADTIFTITALSAFGPFTRLDGYAGTTVVNSGNNLGTQVVSQGLIDVPAVPEPATWAMMILGMSMVGMGLRLRRRVLA